jgi:putative FmdB family regulatory protein
MPKYSFICECGAKFTKTLKIGEHKTHICPSCSGMAKQVIEGFGFNFALGEGPPGNSGVTKHDYPTADQAVGQSADARWQEIQARDEVKDKVRKATGKKALRREHGPDNKFIEYSGAPSELIDHRKKVVRSVEAAVKSGKL